MGAKQSAGSAKKHHRNSRRLRAISVGSPMAALRTKSFPGAERAKLPSASASWLRRGSPTGGCRDIVSRRKGSPAGFSTAVRKTIPSPSRTKDRARFRWHNDTIPAGKGTTAQRPAPIPRRSRVDGKERKPRRRQTVQRKCTASAQPAQRSMACTGQETACPNSATAGTAGCRATAGTPLQNPDQAPIASVECKNRHHHSSADNSGGFQAATTPRHKRCRNNIRRLSVVWKIDASGKTKRSFLMPANSAEKGSDTFPQKQDCRNGF